jgi:hypothetical protein
MDLIEVLEPGLQIVFTFLLIIMFYLVWKTLNSFWLKDLDFREYDNLRKGKIDYHNPPRPNSENFSYLLELALMTTSTRQEQLTKYFSRLVKEFIEFDKTKYEIRSTNLSKNLENFLNNPSSWLNKHYNHFNSISTVNRQEYATRFLHEEYHKILIEL